MLSDYKWNNRFMASRECYSDGDVILVGAPMDFTVSYRPGTRYGPQKIRETSYALEEYSPYLNRDLTDIDFFDVGDLDLPLGNISKSLRIIEEAARDIFQDNKKPLFVGGEHLISFPVIRQAYLKYGRELILMHFDAHTDLRKDYMGERYSHASVIHLCTEFLSWKNIYQFGIRSGTREEFEWARENINFFPFDMTNSVNTILNNIAQHPIYITFDIDVLDPAYASGTGTPEPGGYTPQQVFDIMVLLKDMNVIGMDIVEVNPVYDTSDRTSILAAKIIRESLLSFLAGMNNGCISK